MTDAKAAFGTELQLGDGADPEVFTKIAELIDPSDEGSSEVVDVTAHTAPNPFREKIVTLLDAGEVTFDVNWVPSHATHNTTNGLRKIWVNRELRNWKLVFPTDPAVEDDFSAYVTNIGRSFPVAEGMQGSITLTITGKPTYGE